MRYFFIKLVIIKVLKALDFKLFKKEDVDKGFE